MNELKPVAGAGERGGEAARRTIERPAGAPGQSAQFGSDVVADTLRDLDLRYIALNPGASFRGLHDSLVNHLGNSDPQMLLCLHEEHAVAIAQGYAKVTGKAMAAAVHSNVGLMHATMAIFDAWCDRMPVLVIGATGPVDAMKRRPWIDWIHTARDQAAMIRNYTKWDDQPASPGAAREALARAKWIAETAPMGPVYVNLDAGMQEAPLAEPLPPFDIARHMPPVRNAAGAEDVSRLAEAFAKSRRPLILMGRVSRSEQAWRERIQLAERFGASVLTDIKIGAAFPTDHELNGAPPSAFMGAEAQKLFAEADLIVSLDWVDLAGTLRQVKLAPGARIVQVSLDHHLHNGWSMDHQGLPPVDLFIAADPDLAVRDLLAASAASGGKRAGWAASATAEAKEWSLPASGDKMFVRDLALSLREAIGERDFSLLHVTLSWEGQWWDFRHPLDYIGSEGGGGIGGGPGVAVGAALALEGKGRLPVAVLGDGDFLMGATAIWTAVRYKIPLLIVVANNRSFFNDEVHQERMAVVRKRPVENKWIGQRMFDPEPDLAGIARAQGAVGFGPVRDAGELPAIYAEAIRVVEEGGVAVIDVHVEPGYPPVTANAMRQG